MKRILSVALALAMLISPMAFAAPGAVATESVAEAVAPAAEQAAQLAAAINPANVLYYGIPAVEQTFAGDASQYEITSEKSSGNFEVSKNEETETLDINFLLNWKCTKVHGNGAEILAGNVYTLVYDFAQGADYTKVYPTFNSASIVQQIGSGSIVGMSSNETNDQNFAAGKPYKVFKLAEGKKFSTGVIGVGAPSGGTSISIKSMGLYYKPEAKAIANTVYNKAENKVEVTYTEGLYKGVAAALETATFAGVDFVSINGDTVTYTIVPETDVVIPAIVNAEGTASYPEQTLFIGKPDRYAAVYGYKLYLENFDTMTPATYPVVSGVESTLSLVADANDSNDKALKITTTGGYRFVWIKATETTFDFTNYSYNFFMDVESYDKANHRLAALSGNYVLSDKNPKFYISNAGRYEVEVKSASELCTPATLTQGKIGLVNSGAAGHFTVDNFGIYYKPQTTLPDAAIDYDEANNKAVVTYALGLDANVEEALELYPEEIKGLVSAEVDGNVVTYTYKAGSKVTIPSLIAANGNAVYPAQTLYLDIDEYTLKYGVREFFDDFSVQKGINGGGATASYDNERLIIESVISKENPEDLVNLNTVTVSMVKDRLYTIFADIDNTIAPENPTNLAGLTYRLHAGLQVGAVASWSNASGKTVALDSNLKFEAGTVKQFKTTESYDNNGFYIGVQSTGKFAVDNFGLYYKPVAAAAKATVAVSKGKLDITYPEGIQEDALKAILLKPSLIGAKTASFSGNVLTLTADEVELICVPALVNEAVTGTYAPVIASDYERVEIRPENVETGRSMGIRAVSRISIDTQEKLYEYGYVIARSDALDGSELTLDSNVAKVSKAMFNRETGTNVYFEVTPDFIYFSGVFVNVPKSVENYTTALVFRPYYKFTKDGVNTTVYGEAVEKSICDVADETFTMYESDPNMTDVVDECIAILEYCGL